MRSMGLTVRLFWVLLALGAGLVVAMAVATRWSVRTGLVDYIARAELARLQPLAELLAERYAQERRWPALDARQWRDVLRSSLYPLVPSREPHGAPPRRAPDPSGLPARVRLLDAQQRFLAGALPLPGDEPRLRGIYVQRQLVGWLSLSPPPLVKDTLEERFLNQQLLALSVIAALALAIAALAALGLGRGLVRPILALGDTLRQLAGGDFTARTAVVRGDELGRLASDLNRLGEVLERNEALRREAMADVSHELRTPLALLRGTIEAMQDGILPADPARLASVHEAILRLSHLVDDLYQMALADVGALVTARAPLEVARVLHEALAAAEPALQHGALTLECAIAESLTIEGDARRLRQIVDNLLQNSLRYTDPGGVIRVSACASEGTVELRVEDSAPGVPEAALGRLFDRFYRVEASRNRALGGAGLGLAIVKSLVESHGGTLRAEASDLGGLAIVIRLPEAVSP